MTSTRNRNTQEDYNIENNKNNDYLERNLYIHSSAGRPTTECFPEVGYMPSQMAHQTLSNNGIDIESSLRGIGASNLVDTIEHVNPSFKQVEFKPWFERPQAVIMSYPLVFDEMQRPTLG
jgi:hypothetical protein|tara:strand:- start:34 stop:393 length:360 start_codon:yes stop_codon:yes gene_type:complete